MERASFTVMLLDPEDARRGELSDVLRTAGYCVIECRDLVQALPTLRGDHDVDALLFTSRTVARTVSERSAVPSHFLPPESTKTMLSAGNGSSEDLTQELLLRVGVLCRRGRSRRQRARDLARHLMLADGTLSGGRTAARLRLTPTEYRLLASLISEAGALIPRGDLTRAAWGRAGAPSSNSLDSCVRRLRLKLATLDVPVDLVTVRGLGYRLTAR
jgi:hypothetical protein